MKRTPKKVEDEIRDALAKERKQRAELDEAAAEGIMREHGISPRVGRPPKLLGPPAKRTKTLP